MDNGRGSLQTKLRSFYGEDTQIKTKQLGVLRQKLAMLQPISFEYELDLGEPSPELLDWAKNELGEDPDTRCKVLANFRDVIYKRGECNPHRDDDTFLLRFLRARHFIVPRAHRLLVNYCEFRETNPDLFLNVSLKNLVKIVENDIVNIPTYRDQSGRRIIIFKITHWNPEMVTFNEIFQTMIALLQVGILEQGMQILGVTVLFDFEAITMNQMLQMTPGRAKKIIQIAGMCLPVRVIEIHIVRQPWIFNIAFNVIKPFMTDMMKKNIYFHGYKMKSLHEYVDPEWLPTAYGGKQEHQTGFGWIEHFKQNEVVKNELTSLGYDTEGF